VQQNALVMSDVDIDLPDGRPLLADIDVRVNGGQSVLLSGPSGSGKSTLLRVLGGIWPFGRGRVLLPAGARPLFLPQRPYLPLADLRDAVSYPSSADRFGDEAIRQALVDCNLAHLADRLAHVENWSQRLSLGEQQRIAFCACAPASP
jgi:putative ATP-binding cassette transporter